MLDVLIVVCATIVLCAVAAPAAVDPGKQVNVSLFGTAWMVSADGKERAYAPEVTDGNPDTTRRLAPGESLVVEWAEPRNVSTITIRGPMLPNPKDVELQYWYCIWPDNGEGGWARVDDPFRGSWITVHADLKKGEGVYTYRFAALSKDENPKIEKAGKNYRRTYKIKLKVKRPAVISEVETYTGAEWKEADLKLEWAPRSKRAARWNGEVTAMNGQLIGVTRPTEAGEPVRVKVRYSDSPHRLSTDRGIVVFRTSGWKSFSVYVDDVLRDGGIYVRDIDAFVSDASKKLTYSAWKKPAEAWDSTVIEKIARMPEQSLAQVMRAIPAKDPRENHLGVPNMRQEFTILPSGNIQLLRGSLRCPGRDLVRRPWSLHALYYAMSTDPRPVFTDDGRRTVKRYLEDGYLPVIHCEWSAGKVEYHQTCYATTLMEKIGKNEDSRVGDEPLVLLDKIEITNTGDDITTACLWIELSLKVPMSIAEDGLLVLEHPTDKQIRPGLTPTRGRFDVNGMGDLEIVPDCVPAKPSSPDPDFKETSKPREALRYLVDLQPGESHAIYLSIPYIECLNDAEIDALRKSSFDERYSEVVTYWKKRIGAGMAYEVPDPWLTNLWKANLWHTLITTDRDPATGLYEHFAATMGYLNYINETAMVAQSLEMRGEHREAWRLLEPFAVCQGVKPLPGNFQGKDGLFYSAYPDANADPYTAQGYNMHHGWGLWKLAEHYSYTKDADYLNAVAGQLVKACDWITRERQATKVKNPDGTKPVTWGLAPAGDLEDVEEYLYWYSTNAYYYVGMRAAAQVLAEIGHPEAARIAKDAESYRADLLASVKESAATSPVVKLKDGTWVPFVPPRTNVVTHLKEGWIREGLYPALHLLDGELLPPNHPYITWILNDLEDNVFLSSESGYGVEDHVANFFNLGGFNLQPNLLPNSMAHLRRDEIPQFVRVFYNTFWASYYPDTTHFCEWVPAHGQGAGPLYKTPDECKFIQYMRYMLVLEEGDELRLGMGVPRAWMEDGKSIKIERAATFFGQMDMTITSKINQAILSSVEGLSNVEGCIEAKLTLPTRNPAAKTVLRIRHPEGKPIKRVTVNGQEWKEFDAARELVDLTMAEGPKMEVVAVF